MIHQTREEAKFQQVTVLGIISELLYMLLRMHRGLYHVIII